MANMTLTLKLLVNKRDRKVVFAEANKDFVDFLFNILRLPLGAVLKLLKNEPTAGSLGNLYETVENLNDTYMVPNKTKDMVLNPKPSPTDHDSLLLAVDDSPATARQFYRCYNYRCKYVAEDPKAVCPNCRGMLSDEVVAVVAPAAATAVVEGGFVKGVVTYMVMDDLGVKPMSTISTISLLNKLKIKDVCDLGEKEVHLGIAEGLKLLKASMECKNVLTSVFIDPHEHVEIV